MKRVAKSQIVVPEWGWRVGNAEGTTKLSASLKRFGQVLPLLVRQVGDQFELVDGRRRLEFLDGEVWVHDLGPITKEAAIKQALALEVAGDVDYVKLAECVVSLKDDPDFRSLPAFTPWSGERIDYFAALLNFDWSQYDEVTQELLLSDEETIEFTVPKDEPESEPPPQAPVAAPTVDRAALRGLVRAAAPERRTGAARAPQQGIPAQAPARPRIQMGQGFNAPPEDRNWRPEPPPSLDGISEIELDCEGSGLRWWDGAYITGLALGLPDGKRYYLPTRHAGGNLDEGIMQEWARRELRGKVITNANSRYDNHMLYQDWKIDLEAQGCLWGDVQHYAALLNEYRKGFSLEKLGQDFLGEGKVEGLDKTRMPDYHASQVAEYAKQDVALVHRLKNKMMPLMADQGLERVRQLECEVIYPVCEMERNAALIDTGALQDAVTRSAYLLQEALFDISRQTGFSMNPDKPADWQKLFDNLGLPVPGYTDKGNPSFADELLAKVDHDIVKTARRAGKIASIRSKFLLPYTQVMGDSNKLRFALHQLRGDEYGTVRGRFSMAGQDKQVGKFGANLQQVMRVNSQREAFGFHHKDSSHDAEIFLVRSFFISEDGCDYLSADAQSIEYRVAAHFANSDKLIKAYQADYEKLQRGEIDGPWVDFHETVAGFVRPYKDLSRNIIKNLNFCKIYGGGKDTVARTLGMERAESDQIVTVYDRMFPEFSALIRKAECIAKNRGYVKTVLGRRARFSGPDVPPIMRKFCHKALNYVVQGSAADIMKVKLVELHKARHETGFVMRQTVHDEVDGDARSPETAARVREVLNRQSFEGLKVPIVWEVETGRNWAEAH